MHAIWFGDSWTHGSELEKCIGSDYQRHDQDWFRTSNRFSRLVSDAFGYDEINLAEPGISADRLCMLVDQQLDQISDADLVFVVWPSFSRYFWIDQDHNQHDIRISDRWYRWYRDVDTYPYQMYNAQRAVWSLHNLLESRGIQHYFMNSVYKITEPLYFEIGGSHWVHNPQWRLSDLLEFDPDQGYPESKSRHKYLYPCENHPNLYGHKAISLEIIKFLQHLTEDTK